MSFQTKTIMATFLAYFDLLGYKKFIENNTPEHLDYRTDHFARNIEKAISLDLPLITTPSGRTVSDISQSRLNCLNFSDTVVLWTKGESLEEFVELVKVANKYNSFNVLYDFPSRGCIVYGDLWYKPYNQDNPAGGRYALNMIYGQALIDAHIKAEHMSWAGCILDESAINKAKELGDIASLIKEYTLLHNVPFKSKDKETGMEIEVTIPHHAFRLLKGEWPIIKYVADGIERAFTQDNKGEIKGRVEVIYNNTIDFLKRHQLVYPFYYHSKAEDDHNIYGRLEADFKHTIVRVKAMQDGNTQYEVWEEEFIPDKSERNFLKEPKISEGQFLEQLQIARPGKGG